MNAPLRILHVLGGLERGGIETWLIEMLRRSDPASVRLDFLISVDSEGEYRREIETRGGEVFVLSPRVGAFRYLRELEALLLREGPFAVVHSHLHHFSGIVLAAARRAGVPSRIAHSHTNLQPSYGRGDIVGRAYRGAMRMLIRRRATLGLACSPVAADDLFSPDWRNDHRFRVQYCGIPLERFGEEVEPSEARREIGVDEDSFVVGHVGRLVEPKNHRLLIEALPELERLVKDPRLLLVGDGPLREDLERRARSLGVGERVIFLGARGDVPRIMRSVMDVLALPSRYEGLGLVAVEAQAAGAPVVASDAVPAEVAVVPGLVERIPLSSGPAGWAEALVRLGTNRRVDRRRALEIVRESPFNLERAMAKLLAAYTEPLRDDAPPSGRSSALLS